MPKFLTPPTLPESEQCRSLEVPADLYWLGIFNSALLELTNPYNFEQVNETDLTPEETAAACYLIFEQWLQSTCAGGVDCPTPFWDEAQDVEDSAPAETQAWYGQVENPEAPADELTFVENATIWVFTGFVAYAAGVGAAIFFHTIAEKWVLAWRRGDVGEIIRVIIDGAEYGTVDTSSASVGDIVEFPVLAGTGGHDILIVKAG